VRDDVRCLPTRRANQRTSATLAVAFAFGSSWAYSGMLYNHIPVAAMCSRWLLIRPRTNPRRSQTVRIAAAGLSVISDTSPVEPLAMFVIYDLFTSVAREGRCFLRPDACSRLFGPYSLPARNFGTRSGRAIDRRANRRAML